MRQAVIALATALHLVGCQKKDAQSDAGPAETPAAPKRAPAQATRGAEADPPKEASKPNDTGKKAWALKIAGKGELSGPTVMMTKPSKVATYALLGGTAMTYVHVEDSRSDAYMVQVGFPGEMCMYRADNKQLSKGIAVKLADAKYEIAGEITCGPVGAGTASAQKSVHEITGYFEKK